MDNVVLKSSQRVFLSFSETFDVVRKRLENGTFAFRPDHASAVAAHVSSTCKPALTMPHLSHPITAVLHRPIKLRQLVVSRSSPQSVLTVLTKEPIQTVENSIT